MEAKTIQKIIVLLWLIIGMSASILLLFLTWNGNIFKFLKVVDQAAFKTYAYTFFAGVLGSQIYACRGFYQSIVEPKDSSRAFNFIWIYWYLIRPFIGGIFGFIIYAFSRAELIAFGLTTKITEQNNLMFFSLSFLAGFGFHEFAEYITRKVKHIFKERK